MRGGLFQDSVWTVVRMWYERAFHTGFDLNCVFSLQLVSPVRVFATCWPPWRRRLRFARPKGLAQKVDVVGKVVVHRTPDKVSWLQLRVGLCLNPMSADEFGIPYFVILSALLDFALSSLGLKASLRKRI